MFTWRGNIKPENPFSWVLMDSDGEVAHISSGRESGVTYLDALDIAKDYSQDLPDQYFSVAGKPEDEYPYEFTPRGHGIYITEWGTPSDQWTSWLGPRPKKPYYWVIRDLDGLIMAKSSRATRGTSSMDAWYKALAVEKSLPRSI